MLPSLKKEGSANTKVLSKREEKKRINIRSNSTLFFQVGLIISMLIILVIVESKWEIKEIAYNTPKVVYEDDYVMSNFIIEVIKKEPEVKKEVPVKEQKVIKKITDVIKEVPDYKKVTETTTKTTEVVPDKPVKKAKAVKKPEKTIATTNINGVDSMPLFPGCESSLTNEERKACLSSKIKKFVGRKFDTDKFVDKYAGQKNKVNVQFTIDSKGNVTNVKASSLKDDLKAEAIRVISKLPKMQPGKISDQNVNVIYTLPITLNIDY